LNRLGFCQSFSNLLIDPAKLDDDVPWYILFGRDEKTLLPKVFHCFLEIIPSVLDAFVETLGILFYSILLLHDLPPTTSSVAFTVDPRRKQNGSPLGRALLPLQSDQMPRIGSSAAGMDNVSTSCTPSTGDPHSTGLEFLFQ
jgi:hypothetical protein